MSRWCRCGWFGVLIVLLCEIRVWFHAPGVDSVIDSSQDQKLRVNFDITMPGLPCEYASVDVTNLYGGNDSFIVTKDIGKWRTDENGTRREFHSRDTASADRRELGYAHEDRENVVHLSSRNFKAFLESNDNVIVLFHAPWAVWSRKLEPTWKAFADFAGHHFDGRMRIAQVDCVTHKEPCQQEGVQAFPTVTFFKWGVALENYTKDRSLVSLVDYASAKLTGDEETPTRFSRLAQSYAGCQLSGVIMTNRLLGTLHIKAGPGVADIVPTALNFSHMVNSLDFEAHFPALDRLGWVDSRMPLEELSSLEGGVHTIKVALVPTFAGGTGSTEKLESLQYQMVVSSLNSHPDANKEPGAHFFYDLRPVNMFVTQRRTKWFDVMVSTLGWQ